MQLLVHGGNVRTEVAGVEEPQPIPDDFALALDDRRTGALSVVDESARRAVVPAHPRDAVARRDLAGDQGGGCCRRDSGEDGDRIPYIAAVLPDEAQGRGASRFTRLLEGVAAHPVDHYVDDTLLVHR